MKQSGFSASRRPDHTEEFAGADFEIDILQGIDSSALLALIISRDILERNLGRARDGKRMRGKTAIDVPLGSPLGDTAAGERLQISR